MNSSNSTINNKISTSAKKENEMEKKERKDSKSSETLAATLNKSEKLDIMKDNKEIRLEQSKSQPDLTTMSSPNKMSIPEATSDFNQWLHAMKMVARLPGGMPIEFRRKLWLALSERYLKKRGVNWEKEQIKWFSEKCRADDEELGDQIVKDLHRTGSSLCSGPSGTLNQAKLKRLLIGYTRWNPEVGYCQGFNMLGALILQVMDKNEVDSLKVMIFLIEGLLPPGYFHGSLGGLQADMAVFRELLGNKLPKLARHLQKLQNSPNEASFEPPLTNVFTMQWFLTLFCNCLPMNCVLRIWDLIIIEGSDILLRTALAIWQIFEEKILKVRTADDFYCKMESLSAQLLNGNLIDSNGLVQKISDFGPIPDLHKMRSKHLNSIANYKDSSGEDLGPEDPRLAVATAWGIRSNRRGSNVSVKGQSDREKIALDINILKKQYDKLRERQKQAHIILTSACSKQPSQSTSSGLSSMNKLLVGKNAIVSKTKGRAPKGAIPPARIPHKTIKPIKTTTKHSKSEEPVNWKEVKDNRRNTMKWKDIKSERKDSMETSADVKLPHSASASSLTLESKRKSESSSYSEDSDGESSTSTSLCDEDIAGCSASSVEASPLKKRLMSEVPDEKKKNSLRHKRTNLSDAKGNFDESKRERPDVLFTISDIHESTCDYLDLPSPPCGITSTSQLSPIADISKYITSSSISPIKTPSNMFDFVDYIDDFSEPGILEIEVGNKFQVSEEGVTNEFFERVTSSDRINELRVGEMLLSNPSFNYNLDASTDNDEPPYSPIELRLPTSSSVMANCTENLIPTITSDMIHQSICDKSDFKGFKQKSLSMDGSYGEERQPSPINRSVSDGTIKDADERSEEMKRIIEENLKILGKIGKNTLQINEETTEEIILEEVDKLDSPSRSSDKQEGLKSSIESDDWIDPNVYEHPITHSPPRHSTDGFPVDRPHHKYTRSYSISDEHTEAGYLNTYETTESTNRRVSPKVDSRSSSIENDMNTSYSEQHSLNIDRCSEFTKSPQRSFESSKSRSPDIQSPTHSRKSLETEHIAKDIVDGIIQEVAKSHTLKFESKEKSIDSTDSAINPMSESERVLNDLKSQLEKCKKVDEEINQKTIEKPVILVSEEKDEETRKSVPESIPKEKEEKLKFKTDSELVLEKLNKQLEKCTGIKQEIVEEKLELKEETKIVELKESEKTVEAIEPKEEIKETHDLKEIKEMSEKRKPKEKSEAELIIEQLNSERNTISKKKQPEKQALSNLSTDKTENYKENAVEAKVTPVKSESEKILEKLNSHLDKFDKGEMIDDKKDIKKDENSNENKSESDRILEKLNLHLTDKVVIPAKTNKESEMKEEVIQKTDITVEQKKEEVKLPEEPEIKPVEPEKEIIDIKEDPKLEDPHPATDKLSDSTLSIDEKSESEKILEKLNKQLEKCGDSKKHERAKSETHSKSNPSVEMGTLKKDRSLGKIYESQVFISDEPQPRKNQSETILEKLNAQLGKYEQSNPPFRRSRIDGISNERKSLIELERLLSESDSDDTSKSYSRERRISPASRLSDDSKTNSESYTNALFDLLGSEHKTETRIKEYYTEARLAARSSSNSRCSSPSNITETLSSIQHTIKSLDTVCKKKSDFNAKKLSKAMEHIEKICEADDWKSYRVKKSNSPTFKIDDFDVCVEPLRSTENRDKLILEIDRPSRDRSRDRSPRRPRRLDDGDETYLKHSRTPSPRISVTNIDDRPGHSSLYDSHSHYSSRSNSSISNMDYVKTASKSPTSPSKFSDKLDIRHTSVTSTLYDRYQHYKKEQKFDRSPTSPVLSKSYAYSPVKSPVRSPSFTSSPNYLKSPSHSDRYTKSAETSPSRYDYLRDRKSPITDDDKYTRYDSKKYETKNYSDSRWDFDNERNNKKY